MKRDVKRRGVKLILLFLALWVLVPLGVSFLRYTPPKWSWSQAPRDSTGLAPDPATYRAAVVQVYAARAFNWRGIFAIHPWISIKRENAEGYTRYDVVGWGGGTKVRENYGPADGLWYGAEPELLADFRGADAAALIDRIEAAVATYPFKDIYRTWPGPNSNTFLAHIARSVPEMRLDLPANAIGKDYRPWHEPFAAAPSGTGFQVSLVGLAGITVGLEEGIEVNLLSLSFGIDFRAPALRLPGVGRLGVPEAAATPPGN